jgi:hypothetical protein
MVREYARRKEELEEEISARRTAWEEEARATGRERKEQEDGLPDGFEQLHEIFRTTDSTVTPSTAWRVSASSRASSRTFTSSPSRADSTCSWIFENSSSTSLLNGARAPAPSPGPMETS